MESLSGSVSNRTKGDEFKLEGTLRLDVVKKFFTVRVTKCWHRPPRDVPGGIQGEVG